VAFTPNLLPRGGPRREWDPNAIQGSRDAYDASIAYLDHELGRLFRALDQRGLLRNTIVVVTSDHGEEFGEHGMIGHANGLYRPSVMVPLVLVAPGVQPRRVNTPVSIRDVSSTLLDLLAFPEHPLPGHSLARFWMDSAQASTAFDPVITTLRYGPRLPDWYPVSHGPVRSILDGRWRYIVQRDGAQELYDFEADSLEQNNLAATDPGRAIASRLRVLVDSLARDRGGPR
jgi:arylsulfatase A-like enzyme